MPILKVVTGIVNIFIKTMDKVNIFDNGIKVCVYTLSAGVIYFAGMIGTQSIANFTSPKIQSQTQLEQLLNQERKKIEPNNEFKIRATLTVHDNACSKKIKDNEYEIEMGSSFANETTLRHELYHILDGHFENIPKSGLNKWITYLFWVEPQATIYQATGLKL